MRALLLRSLVSFGARHLLWRHIGKQPHFQGRDPNKCISPLGPALWEGENLVGREGAGSRIRSSVPRALTAASGAELFRAAPLLSPACSLCSADSKAIVDGNLKLILGLIWTLILHYSISMPMWDEEEDEEAKKQTPKQRLLGWIQNKLPQLPITNFSRDWQSGRALGALVDSCAPGERGRSGAWGWPARGPADVSPSNPQPSLRRRPVS